MRPCRSRKESSCWRLRRRSSPAASRARARSRMASCFASGTQTPASSPARCSRGKCDGVTPVGLNPLTWPLRDQGRCHHQAVMTKLTDLTIQPVACRTSLVADVQPTISTSQLLDRPLNRCRRVLDLADESHLARATALGNRYRVLRLCHVKTDKRSATIPHGPSSMREARLGPSEQPSNYRMKGRTTDLTPGT